MTFKELQLTGMQMGEEEIAASLHALTQDRRFAAVVELLRQEKDLASNSSSQLKFANHHGSLAHAAGVRYAHLELEERIRAACHAPVKRKAKNPPPEPEE